MFLHTCIGLVSRDLVKEHHRPHQHVVQFGFADMGYVYRDKPSRDRVEGSTIKRMKGVCTTPEPGGKDLSMMMQPAATESPTPYVTAIYCEVGEQSRVPIVTSDPELVAIARQPFGVVYTQSRKVPPFAIDSAISAA